jgi:hypothetical protein
MGMLIMPFRIIFGVVLIGALLWLAVICAMKGKWVFFAVGWFSGIFWIIGAWRLGKPNSYWAKRRYGDAELMEAERRFSGKMFLFPRLGDSSFRQRVDDQKPDPPDTGLGKMG